MKDNNIHSEENKLPKKLSSKFRFIIALLCLLFILVAIVVVLLTQGNKSDPESEAKIRDVIANFILKDPNDLTDEDFAKINEIRLGHLNIYSWMPSDSPTHELSDIYILEKCTNLKVLRMENIIYPEKTIPKWMKILAKLGVYDINKRFRIDLKPLSKIQTLELVQIENVPITNIKALAGHKNINKLFLSDNDISDCGPLKELKNLNTLSLNGTNISNLEPLKDLVNLHTLFLDSTKISNLEPLRGLINLETLIVSNTSVSDIEPLKNMVNLKELFIYNTQVSTLEPIKNLKNLEKLYIGGTNITDLEPVKGMTNLKTLYLENHAKVTSKQIDDLQNAMPNLEIIR